MELGLPGILHRSGHGEGQGRQFPEQDRGRAGSGQGIQLLLQRLPVGQGVDEAVPLLKITVDLPAQRPVTLQGRLLGLPVEPGGLRPEFPDQLPVDQSVLGGDLPGGAAGGPATDAVRFHQGAVHPGLLQHPGTQQARDPAADHQHVGLQIALQPLEAGQTGRPRPYRIDHRAHSLLYSGSMRGFS